MIENRVSVEDGIPVHVFVLAMTISTIGSSLLTLIIVVSVGLLCRKKCSQRHEKGITTTITTAQLANTSDENSDNLSITPIYEELASKDDSRCVELSQNLAYGQLM